MAPRDAKAAAPLAGSAGPLRGARLLSSALAVAVLSMLLFAATARAAPDRTGSVTPSSPFTWDGTLASGANATYSSQTGEPCGKTPADYCDVTLLNVNVDPSYWSTHGGGVQISIGNYRPDAASDFDLYVYTSDASGTRGQLVGSSGDVAGRPERTTVANASGYYLIQVVYFTVAASQYSGKAEFVSHAKTPPDIDNPPGFQDFLASNPALGFRSHSEPHLAQSPLNPSILVGGSKFYNRDPDSLKEYEFKIGTYASFDNGRDWTDLGQLDVCPPSQAPPDSWPNNTCYPDENPNLGGTGPEDTKDSPTDTNFDPRGSGDFGEEYITSDVWTQFDDEGNAYAMILDSPPFPSGNGWGMSFHRWESVSPSDLGLGGTTWGPKIVINNYTSSSQQALLLDDKNTFAVNNAGPDNDGKIGTMVACWGQNIPDAIKQQIVCKRSTDGGKTWPGVPVPISGATHLVIGVHVVADTRDPNTFYAFWLSYATGIAGAPDSIDMAKSVDGGQTWTAPTPIAFLTGVPRTFPGQGFRNLSLPIAAAAPNGDVYVVYPDYRTAPQPGDADGNQSDIMMLKSTNGGVSWTSPAKVNQDSGNADQFQPYVAVTPTGRLEVSYFDRRKDPDNFFIDLYLSGSSNGGQTFQDARVSHDMWDPTINPPISPSGDFIGDYQGLVADRCHAIPFYQDTHLANDPLRDPAYDAGLPRSPYQEMFAWRVPTGACPTADLSVTQTDSPDPAHVGQNLTYAVRVKNNGPNAATGVSLSDQLPKNAGFGSVSSTQGSCSLKPAKRLVACSLGGLNTGATATVTIIVKPTQKGTITNIASASLTSPEDPNTANNTSTEQTTVQP